MREEYRLRFRAWAINGLSRRANFVIFAGKTGIHQRPPAAGFTDQIDIGNPERQIENTGSDLLSGHAGILASKCEPDART